MGSDHHDDDLLTMAEVAAVLRMPLSTLRTWRVDGGGPRGTKIGKRVLFRRRDVNDWVADRFEPSVSPPVTAVPERAVAAGRYFPWGDVVESVAMAVAAALGASVHEANMVNNAAWAAMPDFYETYMTGIELGAAHEDAERAAMDQLGHALDQHLRPIRKARVSGNRRTEAAG